MARRPYSSMIYGSSSTVTTSEQIAYTVGAALRSVVPLSLSKMKERYKYSTAHEPTAYNTRGQNPERHYSAVGLFFSTLGPIVHIILRQPSQIFVPVRST